jgi:hypothetical protein
MGSSTRAHWATWARELPAPVPTLGWLLLPHPPPTRTHDFEISGKIAKKIAFFIFVQFAILFGTNPEKRDFLPNFRQKSLATFPNPYSRPPGQPECQSCQSQLNFTKVHLVRISLPVYRYSKKRKNKA